MYRQYENPRMLEKQLAEAMEKLKNPDYIADSSDIEYIEELRDRINFAWQDEEFEEMCREADMITGGAF